MNQAIAKAKSRSNFKTLRSQQLPVVETSIVQQVAKTVQLLINCGKLQGHLGIYWPITGEVDLRPLQPTLTLPLALPACHKDKSLSYHPWTSTPLQKDACMIPAPLNEPALKADELGLLLIPALAIDQRGIRLGYGGGFYDRLRENWGWRKVPALAVIPQASISTELLPRDHWDVPLDGWICETGMTKLKQQ